MKEDKIAIALSGGVDSAFAAYLLAQEKKDIAAVTMIVPGMDLSGVEKAKNIANILNIPHFTIDLNKEFKKKIIQPFVNSYLKGNTPNPCVLCNNKIKFGYLWQLIKRKGFSYLATGHYLKVQNYKNNLVFSKAKDRKKSQEYFLGLIKPDLLKNLLFPLGNYTKEEVKFRIKQLGWKFILDKESQEICFLKGNNYANFIRAHLGNKAKELQGDIINFKDKKILGQHKGFYYFTRGQRKGLGICAAYPLYVCDINAKQKEVIVGTKEQALKKEFKVRNPNWFIDVSDNWQGLAQVRYNSELKPVLVQKSSRYFWQVCFLKGKEVVSPGQLAAFYEGDYLVGAGIIT